MEYMNECPRNLRLNGDNLPALLLGGTYIDLRSIGESARKAEVPIEFIAQHDEEYPDTYDPRYFIQRDFSAGNLQEIYQRGTDYRIELLQHIDGTPDELEDIMDVGGGVGRVRVFPMFRIWNFDIRPPCTQRFVRDITGRPRNLFSAIQRYIILQDRDISYRLRKYTE